MILLRFDGQEFEVSTASIAATSDLRHLRKVKWVLWVMEDHHHLYMAAKERIRELERRLLIIIERDHGIITRLNLSGFEIEMLMYASHKYEIKQLLKSYLTSDLPQWWPGRLSHVIWPQRTQELFKKAGINLRPDGFKRHLKGRINL